MNLRVRPFQRGIARRVTLVAFAIAALWSNAIMAQNYLVGDVEEAPLRGAYELTFTAAPPVANPYLQGDLKVTFTRPDGSNVTVDGFYDGGDTFKARAYLGQPGTWRWRSASSNAGLNGKSGTFRVSQSSDLPGKLQKHPQDPLQFAWSTGEWFLHIGDTGYRYINGLEPKWQAFIDQGAEVGFTKIRTWFGTPGGGSNGDIAYMFEGDRLNLKELQAADERVVYALNHYPRVQIQLIPFGEDSHRLRAYAADEPLVKAFAREVQARFAALPNVQWTLSNDRRLDEDKPLRDAIDKLGQDWAPREPWGTLITNHQARRQTYAFVDAPWSDIITFEHIDQVAGERILYYRNERKATDPVVNDEDRYECYISPTHRRYYFRRLFWASLISGGHATYGGGVTWQPYEAGTNKGIQGYRDQNAAGVLQGGADDFRHIQTFFADTGLTMVGLKPDDALVGNDAMKFKAIRGQDVIIAYAANPAGTTPQTDNVSSETPTITIRQGVEIGGWHGYWFDPRTGKWTATGELKNDQRALKAPAGEDWVLLLSRSRRNL